MTGLTERVYEMSLEYVVLVRKSGSADLHHIDININNGAFVIASLK